MSGPWKQTRHGIKYDLIAPQPEQISIADVAHSLARQCRYDGHCKYFYSIAQHSVLASEIVEDSVAFEALMHDAHESVTGDVSTPVKRAVGPAWDEFELIHERVFAYRFTLSPYAASRVKTADLVMLATECRDLMVDPPEDWNAWPATLRPLKDRIQPWPVEYAADRFMERFVELGGFERMRT